MMDSTSYVTVPMHTVFVFPNGSERAVALSHSRLMDLYHNQERFDLDGCHAMVMKVEAIGVNGGVNAYAYLRLLRIV